MSTYHLNSALVLSQQLQPSRSPPPPSSSCCSHQQLLMTIVLIQIRCPPAKIMLPLVCASGPRAVLHTTLAEKPTANLVMMLLAPPRPRPPTAAAAVPRTGAING